MDLTTLKAVMDWASASPLREFEWSDGETRIHLVKAQDGRATAAAGPASLPVERSQQIVSPMFGTFHSAPSPQAQPHVRVGQTVKAGDVVCLVEAMKMFHTVTAERDGVIAAILVESGAEVAAGQPLFELVAESLAG